MQLLTVMRRAITYIFALLLTTTLFAQGKPTFTLTAEENAYIDSQITGLKDYIKFAYDYDAAQDTRFATIVQNYIDRYKTYLEKNIIVDKAEKYYTVPDPDYRVNTEFITPVVDTKVNAEFVTPPFVDNSINTEVNTEFITPVVDTKVNTEFITPVVNSEVVSGFTPPPLNTEVISGVAPSAPLNNEVVGGITNPIGASALQSLDGVVKEALGYNRLEIEHELSGTQRVFSYDIYPILFAKSIGLQQSPYSGLAKFFASVADVGMKPVSTEEIPNAIEKLLTDLKDIRDNKLTKGQKAVERIKLGISLKSSNYVSQSEMEREPLKSYSSPYKKEEIMRYAMADKARINQTGISQDLNSVIKELEYLQYYKPMTEEEVNSTKIKIQAFRKYVHVYKAEAPAKFLYTVWKETESSGYMMAALAIQDMVLYKFPDVFLTKEKAEFYKQYSDRTFKQNLVNRFANPKDLTTYKSFGAFVVTSHLIRALPTPTFIMKMSKYVDSKIYGGVAGTRIRGLALFAISMTVASKVSEAVSLYSQFSGELDFATKDSVLSFINNKENKNLKNIQDELNSLAKDYLSKSLAYSVGDFAVSTGNFLISFAISEAIMKQITGRLMPWGYYGVGNKLNKTKCGAAAINISNKIINSKVGNIFNTIFIQGAPMFLLATFTEKYMEIAESYYIDDAPKQKAIQDIMVKLSALEYELLGAGLKAYINSPMSRVALYDKMDDLKNIEGIVEYLRQNDEWIIGTMKMLLTGTLDIESKNKKVDEFLTEVFDTVRASVMNPDVLKTLDKYKGNATYAAGMASMYSEEDAKQSIARYKEIQGVIKESGDSVIMPLADIDVGFLAANNAYGRSRDFMVSKFFNDLKAGVWGDEQKSALIEIIKASHKPEESQAYVALYSKTIDDALNYPGTPDKKLNNLFSNIYPNFIENKLLADNDRAEFEYFGEDLLNILAYSLYGSFMQGVYALPTNAERYWAYMECVSRNVVYIGLHSNYPVYAYTYLRLTMFFTISAPEDMSSFRLYKEWKNNSENINKTYKEFRYEQWKENNPNEKDKSFDAFAAKKWAEILNPVKIEEGVATPFTEQETKDGYGSWKSKRETHGL